MISTEMKEKKQLVMALKEMRKRGEITEFESNVKTDSMKIDRSGDEFTLNLSKEGNYNVGGDNRLVERFSNRLKQFYALESIKENLPLDFEVAEESETEGEMRLILKG